MAKPSPTTETCRRILENFLASFPQGWEKVNPNARPTARATGGDTNPLALIRRHTRKTTRGHSKGAECGGGAAHGPTRLSRPSPRIDSFGLFILDAADGQ